MLPGLAEAAKAMLEALAVAYADTDFQDEIVEIKAKASGDELAFLTALGRAAGRVQAPVFERFGLPAGQRGVMLMKMGVKVIAQGEPELKAMSGDLREQLGLKREEEEMSPKPMLQNANSNFKDLVQKISAAPLDIRGPLAEALQLPYKASPEEIAMEVPNIKRIAEGIAARHLKKEDTSQFVGEGKVLGPEMATASQEEVKAKLAENFDRYITKMLARVVTSVDSFTRPPSEFRCAWADGVVEWQHARELWGPPDGGRGVADPAPWRSLGIGVSVLDSVVEMDLVLRVRKALDKLEAAGETKASEDPCNVGACSVWLHFESEEERAALDPALREICFRLAGLPFALEAAAERGPDGAAIAVPSFRIHPHVMAATYRRGAEYHCHRDSYDGRDNRRMLSVLLYLNHEWSPGDGGELRVFADGPDDNGTKAPDHDRHVDIAPLSGRLVMFRSRDVWHAVREPREQRWALTLWVMAE